MKAQAGESYNIARTPDAVKYARRKLGKNFGKSELPTVEEICHNEEEFGFWVRVQEDHGDMADIQLWWTRPNATLSHINLVKGAWRYEKAMQFAEDFLSKFHDPTDYQ